MRPSTQIVGPPLPTESKASAAASGRYQERCFQPIVVGSRPGSSATQGSRSQDLARDPVLGIGTARRREPASPGRRPA